MFSLRPLGAVPLVMGSSDRMLRTESQRIEHLPRNSEIPLFGGFPGTPALSFVISPFGEPGGTSQAPHSPPWITPTIQRLGSSAYCLRAVPLTVVVGVVAMKRNSRKSSPAVPKKLICRFQAGMVMVLLSTQTVWPSPTGIVVKL